MNDISQLRPTRWHASWFELDPRRLTIERDAMGTKFPSFKLNRLPDGRLAWQGNLQSNRGNTYQIMIIYPETFPYKEPQVFPINPIVRAMDVDGKKFKHQYPDGHLCLYYPGDRDFDVRTTAATVIAVAAAWFFAYECWLESGRKSWPGPEVNH